MGNDSFLLKAAVEEIRISERALRGMLSDYTDRLEREVPDAAARFVDRMEGERGFAEALLDECRASMVGALLAMSFDEKSNFEEAMAFLPKASHDSDLQAMRRFLVGTAIAMNRIPKAVGGVSTRMVDKRVESFLAW